jgi:hypothetical protein
MRGAKALVSSLYVDEIEATEKWRGHMRVLCDQPVDSIDCRLLEAWIYKSRVGLHNGDVM